MPKMATLHSKLILTTKYLPQPRRDYPKITIVVTVDIYSTGALCMKKKIQQSNSNTYIVKMG